LAKEAINKKIAHGFEGVEYSKNAFKKSHGARDMAQIIECLLREHEALSSNPVLPKTNNSTTKKKKKRNLRIWGPRQYYIPCHG
jgi:hypothetical protein